MDATDTYRIVKAWREDGTHYYNILRNDKPWGWHPDRKGARRIVAQVKPIARMTMKDWQLIDA